MKALARIVGLILCVGMTSMSLLAQTAGDFRSKQTGNWGTSGTWQYYDGNTSSWRDTTGLPKTSAPFSNVTIQAGDTVIVEASPKYCNNLTVESGALLYANAVVTSPRYVRVYGTSVTNNGTIGGTSDALGMGFYTPRTVVTLTGSGSYGVSRIQPAAVGVTVVFDANVGINYAGGSGTGSSALYNNGQDSVTFTINANKTVTMAPYAYVSVSTSASNDPSPAYNLTLNIYGTLTTGSNAHVNLRNGAGKTSILNVYSGGTLNCGGNLILFGAGTTTVSDGGSITVSGTADFSDPVRFISGTGSFALNNGASIKVGAAAGLDPTNGPVRTGTRTYPGRVNYTFQGNNIAFATGSDMPATAGRLTLNDTTGTLTLTNSLQVDTAVTLTNGKILTGTNILTIGGAATLSGFSATKFVDGNLARTIAAPGAIVWPTGLGSDYVPTTLYCSSVTTPGKITMSILDTAVTSLPQPRFGGFKILKHYMKAVGDQILEAAIDSVGISFLAADVPAGVDTSSLQVKRSRNNNQWASLVTNRIDTVARQIVVSGDIGDGNWIVTGPGPAFYSVSSLNFGTVTVGNNKLDSVVVANIGNTSLQIDSVRSTSTEFTVTPTSGSLAPGTTEKFYVTYSPTSAGAAVAHVVFYNNGINWTDSLLVTGSLYATFTASPDSIDFGTIARNASKIDSLFVANNGNIALSIDSVKSSDPSFLISPTAASVPAGTNLKYTVTYHPTSGGAKLAVIVFYSNSTTHPDTVWVKGDVLVAPAFSMVPTSMDFGSVFTGQHTTDSVAVTNTGTATLDITSVVSTNADYTITPTSGSIAVDATTKFYIQFTPSANGTRSGKIAFNHNASTKDTLAVTGKGVTIGTVKAARLAANGTEVVFEAIVTRAKGNYTYMQDTSAGICMYQSTGAWKDSVTSGGIRAGDKIRVDGATSEYSSLKEIAASGLVSFTILSRDNPIPSPQLVTLANITANGENYESELVKVLAVTVDPAGDATYTAAKTYNITDPTDATHATALRIPNAGDSDVDGSTILSLVTFTGVVGQYSSTGTGGYQLMAINANDLTDNALSVDDAFSGVPREYSLENNYPNPFNPSTTILYGLPQQSRVTVKIFSILGQEVKTLVDETQSASFHRVKWNGKDNGGMQVSSGVYFFRINAVSLDGKTHAFTQVRKMLLMK